VLLAKERVLEAEAEFRHVLELEPGNPRAELGLGEVAYKQSDLNTAVNHFTRAASSNSARKRSHILLARVLSAPR